VRRRLFAEKSFEHRRQWVVERMHYLASLFNIDICTYAIMSNHYHLVLHIDDHHNESLTHEEVCERWQSEQTTSEAENKAALSIIDSWRGGLADISWILRCLNEFIARKANKEDECSSITRRRCIINLDGLCRPKSNPCQNGC